MRRTLVLISTLTLALIFSGCRAKEAYDKIQVAKDLKNNGTIELLEKTSKDEYNPPADGRLTDAQVQMYLKVREAEKEIVAVAKKQLQEKADAVKSAEQNKNSITAAMASFEALGSAADLATSDIRAASKLGVNTAEYTWVKKQILAASGADVGARFAEATNQMADAAYAQMKKQYDEATDEATKKALGDALKQYEESRAQAKADATPVDPAIEYNRQLLAKYENTLNALQTEMAKWDGQQGMDSQQLEQSMKAMEKAAQEAKAK